MDAARALTREIARARGLDCNNDAEDQCYYLLTDVEAALKTLERQGWWLIRNDTTLPGRGVPQPGDRRETCKRCLRPNPLGFTVPDEVWKAAVPHYYQNSVLCILCFDEFATDAGIEWEHNVQFWPVSGATARRVDALLDEISDVDPRALRTKTFNYEEASRRARRAVREAADRVERMGHGLEAQP